MIYKTGMKVIDGEGRIGRVLADVVKSCYYPLAAAMMEGEEEFIQTFTDDGYLYESRCENVDNLVGEYIEPLTVVAWVNVYEDNTNSFHDSQDEADNALEFTDTKRRACIRLTGSEEIVV